MWEADAVSENKAAVHLSQMQAKHARQNSHAALVPSIAPMPGCSHGLCCCSCAVLGGMQLCLKLLQVCRQLFLQLVQALLSKHLMLPADPVQARQRFSDLQEYSSSLTSAQSVSLSGCCLC